VLLEEEGVLVCGFRERKFEIGLRMEIFQNSRMVLRSPGFEL